MRPTDEPPEPDAERPAPGAVPLWARTGDDRWHPVWALPPRGGLAVRLTDPAGRPLLAVVHVRTGYAVLAARVGGVLVEDGPVARRAMIAAMDDLLRGADWTGPMDRADPNFWKARPVVEATLARRLPAVPEWRSWRLDVRGALEHKWHRSERAAYSWALGRRGCVWWAVESWDVPPPRPSRAPVQAEREVAALADAGRPLPGGLAVFEWASDGVRYRRDRAGCGPVEPHGPPDLAAFWDLAWEPVPEARPTGELVAPAAGLVSAGLLRRAVLDDGWVVLAPTLRGLLLAGRQALRDACAPQWPGTGEAAEEWRTLRRAHAGQGRRTPRRLLEVDSYRRLLACLRRLLRCVARDRAHLDATGARRHELPPHWRDPAGESTLLDDRDGVAVARCRRSWVTYRHRPSVSWAPASALVVARHDGETSLHEHAAEDWAMNAAERRRRDGR